MLINAYDTTVGKPFKVADRVESTIKTLHVTRNLTPTKKPGVYVVTHETDLPIPIFAFPITMEGFNRQLITVYDERPFRNKSNAVVNANEIAIMRLAAFMQHDVAEGDVVPLKNCRLMATKAFAEAFGSRLGRRAGLDVNANLTLKVLLAYYMICIQEDVTTDLELLALNVIRSIYGSEKGYILGVVEGVPKLSTLEQLFDAIRNNPVLYQLKGVEFKDFMALLGGISFVALGSKVIIASAEAPCLFTALVYGAARYKLYAKTPLGMALDPKYNKGVLESFTKHIDYTYDLNG
jgi:hypothetical protein